MRWPSCVTPFPLVPLFVLTLIVGLIVDSAKTWQAAYNHDDASM